MWYYLSILLVVISGVFYHVSQKKLPESVDPMTSLSFSYTIAFLLSIMLWPISTKLLSIDKSLNFDKFTQSITWPAFFVGLTIVGIELGVMLAYRFGGKISNTSLVIQSVVAVILLFIGIYWFNETISATKVGGIVLCVLGLLVIAFSK